LIGARKLSAVGLNFAHHFLAVVETYFPVGTIKSGLFCTPPATITNRRIGQGRKSRVPYLTYIYRIMAMGESGPGSCRLEE
jgi:hypothetical protein